MGNKKIDFDFILLFMPMCLFLAAGIVGLIIVLFQTDRNTFCNHNLGESYGTLNLDTYAIECIYRDQDGYKQVKNYSQREYNEYRAKYPWLWSE